MNQHHQHPHRSEPATGALFDHVRSVKLNIGGKNGGDDEIVDAYVLHAVDEKNLVLGRFVNGTFQLCYDGKPIPERAVSEYGPEGGGLTWHNA